MWKQSKYKAFALFPYTSTAEGHLNLVQGDVLEIVSETDEWVCGRCISNSCIGICPKSYTAKYESDYDVAMRIIETEVKLLISDAFKNNIIPAREDNPNMCKIIDIIRQIEEYFPWTTCDQANNSQLVKYIEELRVLLLHSKQTRSPLGAIMRTHDINTTEFLKNNNLQSSAYPVTTKLTFVIELASLPTQPIMIRCFLYNAKTKQYATHPKSIALSSQKQCFLYVTPDIDPKLFVLDQNKECELSLVIQATDAVGIDGEIYTDYMGVAAEKLSTQERNFAIGYEQSFAMSFYKPKEGLFSTIHNDILSNNMASLLPVTEIPSIRVTMKGTETIQEATSCVEGEDQERNTFFNIKYPINGSMNYSVNTYTIQIHHLKHKTKIKPTRIICRVIDTLSTKTEYLPVFNETDKTKYTTIPQKGTLEMDFEEITEIKLNPELIKNPDFTYIVFIIERCFRTHGDSYVSSYCFLPLTNDEKKFFEFHEPTTLRLYKPPKDISIESLKNEIATSARVKCLDNAPEDTGYITISTTLVSPLFTSDEKIHKLMTLKEGVDANLEPITINFPPLFYSWGYRIFVALAQVISKDDEANKKGAMTAFINQLQSLTQNATRDPYYNHALDEFKANAFKEDHPEFARLGTQLLKYIGEEFKGGMTNVSLIKSLAHLMSLSVESFNFAKKMNIQVGEEAFNNAFKQVFNATSEAIVSDKTIKTSQSFLIRAFPPIVQLMGETFNQEEIIKLTIKLIQDSSKLGQESKDPKLKTVIIDIAISLTSAEVFKNYTIRKALLPVLVNEITKFNFDIKIVKNIFFAMYGTSVSLADELLGMVALIRKFITCEAEKDFIILFLIYASADVVKALIKNNGDYINMFSTIINLLINAVDSTKSYLLFGLVPAFVKIFLLSQIEEFSDIRNNVIDLIDMISRFYSHFLGRLEKFSSIDRDTYSVYYSIDLAPISRLLPILIESVPANYHFDKAIFIPLFHMFISTKEESIRASVKKSVVSIFTAEGKKFSNIEKPVVHALIAIMSVDGLEEITSLFTVIEECDPSSKESIKQVTELAKNIANLKSFPPNAMFEDEYGVVILSVLERCKRTNDYSIYPHFCLLLYDLHIILNSYVEAAECLINCSDIVEEHWKPTDVMTASSIFPEQTAHERVNQMLHKAFELFMQAQFFERAATTADRLRAISEKGTPDYEELANIIDLQQKAWQEIVTTERTAINRFYGAKFFGDGFHEYHRNKVFVYRRGGYFDNGQMLNYIRQKFPNAEVSPRPPSDEDKGKDYIYVFNVKPQFEYTYCPEEAPASIMVNSVCNIDTFTLEVPVRVRIKEKKYNEIAEYHRDITTYKIALPLQGITRRSIVITTEGPRRLSPVECAVIDTNAKSLELLQKASSYWRCIMYDAPFDKSAVSAFSMLINGIVNAAVNGGTKLFQELFLEGDLSVLEENKKWAPHLRDAFVNQLKVVNFAISVHNHVVDDAFRPLHNQICEQFVEMQKTMEPQVGKVDFSQTTTELGEIPASI